MLNINCLYTRIVNILTFVKVNTLSIVKLNTLLRNFKNPPYVIFNICILFYVLFLKIIKKLHIYRISEKIEIEKYIE